MIFNQYDILFVLLFCILHELGHIIALYLFGGKAKRITIAFYGIGLCHDYCFGLFKELCFLYAGCLVNLTFAFFNVHRDINIALGLINLLPLYPLDGGRALKLILNNKFSLGISDTIFYIISFLFVIGVIVFAIYYKQYSLLFIVLYLILFGIKNQFD